MQLVRLPYHLSALTQAAARAALAHRDALLGTVEAIKEQRDRIVARAARAAAARWPTATPTSCCSTVGRRPAARPGGPCSTRGVLVRDVGLPGWLRVTAGTPAETDAFLIARLEERR